LFITTSPIQKSSWPFFTQGKNSPKEMKFLLFLPEVSHKAATCIWEAPDTASLQNFLDPILGDTSVNTYQVIDEGLAQGLSKLKEAEMHA